MKKLKPVNRIRSIKDVRKLDRFFASKLLPVDTEHGTCWDVNGSKFSNGYSRVGHEPAQELNVTRAHIYMFYLVYNKLAKDCCRGGIVLHKCDNRWCVNPNHLFLGNHAANMKDMVGKDRQARGEKHGNNRYNEEEVILIKYLHKRRGFSDRELAFMFGTGVASIANMVRRDWKHLQIPEEYNLDKALNQLRKLRKRKIIKGFPEYSRTVGAPEPYVKIKEKHYNLVANLVEYYEDITNVSRMLFLSRNSVRNIMESKAVKYHQLKLEQMFDQLAAYLRYREGNRRLVAIANA